MFKNFTNYFDENVKRFPRKQAIIADHETLTYRELQIQSDHIVTYLQNKDLTQEAIIALMCDRSPKMIAAMLAILRVNCAFLPISPLNPIERCRFILENSQAKLMLTDNCRLCQESPYNTEVAIIPTTKPSSQKPTIISIAENNLAYAMYTSGSTGNPKGVLIEHGSMMNLFLSLIDELKLTEEENILALTDYTFDISLIELLMPLMLGATIVLAKQGTVADGLQIKNYLSRYRISLMQATPVSWEILLKQGWRNKGSMKILVGGEKFSTRLAVGLDYQKGNIWNMYGPTETCMWSMYYRLKTNLLFDTVPLGNPVDNTTLWILDKNLRCIAPGQEGELYIGGKGLAREYLHNQILTQQKFILHPETQERLYQTGDRVFAHKDGAIYFMGRTDDQLKFAGIRVEAGEIENIIEREPIVKKAVVKTHEQAGYYKVLAAYIEIDEEKALKLCPEKNDDKKNPFKYIYDEVYLHADTYESGTINTCGWKNSFTGKVFGVKELQESYHFIESVIQNCNLSRVLEVGSGTGSILRKFLDKSDQYVMIEISETSIEYIRNKLNPQQLKKVIFKNHSILDVNEKNYYSCIIINSVVQYFPSVSYLITALKQIIESACENSTIIIGDVRSLELLEFFLLEKNKNPVYYKSRESELILSTHFFHALKQEIPAISHVDIAVKHGEFHNELNYFRYDVILHINKPILYRSPVLIPYEKNWIFNSLKDLIHIDPYRPMVIYNIPNLIIDEGIRHLKKDWSIPVDRLLIDYSKQSTTDVDQNENILELLNINIETHEKLLIYNKEKPLSLLELQLFPKSNQGIVRFEQDGRYLPPNTYCREPFNPERQRIYFNQIKKTIQQHLTSWVTPSVYIWVEKWPLTPNSKLDKKSLELPVSLISIENAHKDNETLANLQKIWKNTVGEEWEIDQDFWIQGISSLHLHFFLAIVNETYEINLNYHELHQHNTPLQLSQFIEHLQKQKIDALKGTTV